MPTLSPLNSQSRQNAADTFLLQCPVDSQDPTSTSRPTEHCKVSKYYSINWKYFFLVIEEKGVRLKLTITDTPGFGDQINNESWLDFNSV